MGCCRDCEQPFTLQAELIKERHHPSHFGNFFPAELMTRQNYILLYGLPLTQ